MFISQRGVSPILGKEHIVEDRLKRAAGLFLRHGSMAARVGKVVAGDCAGEYRLYGAYDSMEAMAKTTTSVQKDPSYHTFAEERHANPAGHQVVGPDVFRLIAGLNDPENMVFMQRVYALNPDGREIGLALFPDVEKLFAGSGIVPSLTVPVFNSDMNMMTVMYAGKDLIHLGKSIDEIGTSQAFRDIAKKVSEGGTLIKSRVVVTI